MIWGRGDVLQNDFKILAALSLSAARFVGQKASDPILFVSLFTGAPSFSKPAQALSNVAFPPCLALSQNAAPLPDDVGRELGFCCW